VLVVRSLDELAARAGEVRGRIVLFDIPFNQPMADAGLAQFAYRGNSAIRAQGPARAAELGAAAALIRSIGGADFRLAHAGNSGMVEGKRIPAASVSTEDALLIGRLAARGPVTMRLVLTPRILPDADSFNVIADWPGTDRADEVVIVSGHLDSWDLGTGANDDATGVVSAMAVIETLRKLDYRPRRTIRMVAWMNEENGKAGARGYLAAGAAALPKHVAAIESDNGSGRPFGMRTSVAARDLPLFAPLQKALLPIGANALQRDDQLATGDLAEMERAGVPSFAPLINFSDYFHYHHTAADTFDKVDPDNLRRHVAVMTATAWFLANLEGPLGRWSDPAR
jgi:Zn-dependent M28 family amino/carboxypeptidase